MATSKTVNVHVPATLNLDQAQKVLASVLHQVGHPACYSGFNINFVNAVDPAPMVLKVDATSLKVAVGE
jgi:hypothetical protein